MIIMTLLLDLHLMKLWLIRVTFQQLIPGASSFYLELVSIYTWTVILKLYPLLTDNRFLILSQLSKCFNLRLKLY